ncbi:hypothetical protein Hanom_Chr07g00596741 [Helianthus anomalus]
MAVNFKITTNFFAFVQYIFVKHNEPGVSLKAASIFLRGKGEVVYILPFSELTLALLLVGFTEYDDDDNC